MCIVCKVKKAIEGTVTQETIGTVSPTLRVDFVTHVTNELLAAIDLEQKVIDTTRALVLKEITEAEFDLKAAEWEEEAEAALVTFEAERKRLWERVYDELGITESERKHNYTLDQDTGVVEVQKRKESAEPSGC
ncbi:hypothetical protein [Paenibacillus agilis]|uniref:Uncharacterized protein n=1 Tax=Paenibacillus agilis TaxID=3020863 RepID=A0A559IXB8_9BACL|nr:hypothetical protein [Paenibacillus agilis]TVX92253.1 hypothetical protein FPZ44_03760 [Paenibacillus agilis]